MRELTSIPGVCDVEHFGPRGEGGAEVLLEVPHGATRTADFEALRGSLRTDLPGDLADFFHVNTDVGAPEVARAVAERLSGEANLRVLLLRGVVPRTFVDLNRALDRALDPRDGRLTPAIPSYVDEPGDRDLLVGLHRRYQAVAESAYGQVCGAGGLAITLHTYAPKSVSIDGVDGSIVTSLRAAYDPAVYDRWPLRPEVDLITRDGEGELRAPAELAAALRAAYEDAGIEARSNCTYCLHRATSGFWHSVRWPGRVLCLEIRRDLLADPYEPFAEMRIGPSKVERMAAPLAATLVAALREPCLT